MKKKALGLSVLIIALFYSSSIVIVNPGDKPLPEAVKISENYLVKNETIYTTLPENETGEITYSPFLGKSINGFKEALGFKESRGNYFVVNSYGYLGKYQFGTSALKAIGVYNTKFFLENPEIQERAFIAYLKRNKWILRKDIKNFSRKVLYGVKVTESGILAAAHLAGAGNVKRYLRSWGNLNFKDANGASIRYYMKKFSDYDLSHIEPNRQAKI